MWRLKGACCLAFAVLAGCSDSGGGGSNGDAAPAPVHPGKAVYERYCFSCHAAGVAGAPKTGDLEAWAPRRDKGMEEMLRATIEGMPPGMPARGLCLNCSDEELTAAIEFMLVNSR